MSVFVAVEHFKRQVKETKVTKKKREVYKPSSSSRILYRAMYDIQMPNSSNIMDNINLEVDRDTFPGFLEFGKQILLPVLKTWGASTGSLHLQDGDDVVIVHITRQSFFDRLSGFRDPMIYRYSNSFIRDLPC